MEKTVENALETITGYLISITRNTKNGWYELEIGIPSTWIFNGNDEINCNVLEESETGKLLNISPKTENISVDVLISFVELIISVNIKIAEKELELNNKMEEIKSELEGKLKGFYEELDELKEKPFNLNDKILNNEAVHKRQYNKRVITKPITGTTS
jgi:hypothetical protein